MGGLTLGVLADGFLNSLGFIHAWIVCIGVNPIFRGEYSLGKRNKSIYSPFLMSSEVLYSISPIPRSSWFLRSISRLSLALSLSAVSLYTCAKFSFFVKAIFFDFRASFSSVNGFILFSVAASTCALKLAFSCSCILGTLASSSLSLLSFSA